MWLSPELTPYVLRRLSTLRNLVRCVSSPLKLVLGLVNVLPTPLNLVSTLTTGRMFLRIILPMAPLLLNPGLRLRQFIEHLGENIILFLHDPLIFVTTPSKADPFELPRLTTFTPVLQKNERQTPPSIRPLGPNAPSMPITEKTIPPLLDTISPQTAAPRLREWPSLAGTQT